MSLNRVSKLTRERQNCRRSRRNSRKNGFRLRWHLDRPGEQRQRRFSGLAWRLALDNGSRCTTGTVAAQPLAERQRNRHPEFCRQLEDYVERPATLGCPG